MVYRARRALIIGHRGQDGTLLREWLAAQGYEIYGFGRNEFWHNGVSISRVPPRLDDADNLALVLREIQPSEIYYLAAHHHSSQNVEQFDARYEYLLSHQTHVQGLVNVLETIRLYLPKARLFYASSSLIFGGVRKESQNEDTPLEPYGFYGITKAEGTLLCREYRKRFDVFAAVGILFNHESHLRPSEFVSKRIVEAALRIKRGEQQFLEIGDIATIVDWSYAEDFIRGFHAALQLDEPDDFVFASGTGHTIQEFITTAFRAVELDWRERVKVWPEMLTRVLAVRVGDASKLRRVTGWAPRYSFDEMIQEMVKRASNSC